MQLSLVRFEVEQILVLHLENVVGFELIVLLVVKEIFRFDFKKFLCALLLVFGSFLLVDHRVVLKNKLLI